MTKKQEVGIDPEEDFLTVGGFTLFCLGFGIGVLFLIVFLLHVTDAIDTNRNDIGRNTTTIRHNIQDIDHNSKYIEGNTAGISQINSKKKSVMRLQLELDLLKTQISIDSLNNALISEEQLKEFMNREKRIKHMLEMESIIMENQKSISNSFKSIKFY